MDHEKILLPEQREMLITDLQVRFSQHMSRHVGLEWAKIQAKLEQQPAKLWSLAEMERTGGEPDVLAYDPQSDSYLFFDCAAESPAGRRSACYDRAAQTSRKAHPPAHNALDLALAMGIELLTEADYRRLHTPSEIRSLGGAIFGDRRYNQVFVYHNGADSYYAARGFRGLLRV